MDIFVINIASVQNIPEELLKGFSFKSFSNKKIQNIHSLSYLMTDRILREVYKISDRKIIFKNNKPILENGSKHFSVSHSGEYIALGFSDCECGIDIEKNKDRNFELIKKRMKFSSKTPAEFYLDWTRYEADFKLGSPHESIKSYKIGNYTLTAVSENRDEVFDIYYQS